MEQESPERELHDVDLHAWSRQRSTSSEAADSEQVHTCDSHDASTSGSRIETWFEPVTTATLAMVEISYGSSGLPDSCHGVRE